VEQIGWFIKQFWLLIGVGIVGLSMVVYGLWGQLVPAPATVEIVKGSESSSASGEIVIDVAGAVLNPGVYKLPSGSRIGDVIVLAGGLSAEADREWVAQTLNLAQEVKDASKIYIPNTLEQAKTPENQNSKAGETQVQGKINVNTASVAELDKLPGIGEVRAQAIVANRPYSDTAELVSRAKVPQSVYDKIRDQISIY
jgi:competence protein ComEA